MPIAFLFQLSPLKLTQIGTFFLFFLLSLIKTVWRFFSLFFSRPLFAAAQTYANWKHSHFLCCSTQKGYYASFTYKHHDHKKSLNDPHHTIDQWSSLSVFKRNYFIFTPLWSSIRPYAWHFLFSPQSSSSGRLRLGCTEGSVVRHWLPCLYQGGGDEAGVSGERQFHSWFAP